MSFRVPSRVCLDDAASVMHRGRAAIAAGTREFDLADVTAADSSLVACILTWHRAAAAAGATLSIVNPPQSVRGLAALYGVEQIALG